MLGKTYDQSIFLLGVAGMTDHGITAYPSLIPN